MGQKVTLNDAAERTGLCVRTIRRYIAAGRLRAYRIGPRAIRIDTDDIDALLRPVGGAA